MPFRHPVRDLAGRFHDAGCPAVADDESDQVLNDYQRCVCDPWLLAVLEPTALPLGPAVHAAVAEVPGGAALCGFRASEPRGPLATLLLTRAELAQSLTSEDALLLVVSRFADSLG